MKLKKVPFLKENPTSLMLRTRASWPLKAQPQRTITTAASSYELLKLVMLYPYSRLSTIRVIIRIRGVVEGTNNEFLQNVTKRPHLSRARGMRCPTVPSIPPHD